MKELVKKVIVHIGITNAELNADKAAVFEKVNAFLINPKNKAFLMSIM